MRTYSSFAQNFIFLSLLVSLWLIATFKLLGFDNDYYSYVDYISNVDNAADGLLEPAFKVVTWLNSFFFDSNVFVVFAVFSGVSLVLKTKFFHETSRYPFFCLFLYFCSYYFLHDYTQIRVAAAGAFFLLALPDIEKKQFFSFAFKCFIATLFHYSALLMIFVYFFVVRIPTNILIFFPFLGAIIYFLQFNVLAGILYSLNYSDLIVEFLEFRTGYTNSVNPFNSLALIQYFILILGIFVWRYRRISLIDLVLLKTLSFSIFTYLLLANSNSPVLSVRVFEFLNLPAVALASNIPRYFSFRIPLFVIIAACYLAQLYYFVRYVWE